MKNRSNNGAANRTAKTSTSTAYQFTLDGLCQKRLLEISKVIGATPEDVLAKGFASMVDSMRRVFVENRVQDIGDWARLSANELEHAAKRKRHLDATVEMKVKISAHSFGVFSQAAVVLGCTAEEALPVFIEAQAGEWANNDFAL